MPSGFEREHVIDAFTSIEAARRVNKRTGGLKTQPTKTTFSIDENEAAKLESVGNYDKASTRIEHTAVPDKYELTCCHCNYQFVLTGKLRKTICSKCRETLEPIDHKIEGECTKPIRTIGNIEIEKGAVVKGTELVARNIIVAGDISEADVNAFGRLELLKGSKCTFAKVKMCDLAIGKGVKLNISKKFKCKNLEIAGKLKANVVVEELLSIKDGGLLEGQVTASRVEMEEGGGLLAQITMADMKTMNDEKEVKDDG